MKEKNYLRNRATAKWVLILFCVVITVFFLIAVFDSDKTVSEKENRGLAQMPQFSFSSLMSGEYISKVETYYSDQFPGRDTFLTVYSFFKNGLTQFSVGDSVVVVEKGKDQDDFHGEGLYDQESATASADTAGTKSASAASSGG